MFELQIYDVSAFVYHGVTASNFKDLFYYNYPVGGIHALMRYVTPALADRDQVVLAFDSRSNFRKELMPDYKSGRVPNKSVITQIDTLYEELSSCGFSCYRFDGFEGDDIIAWACTQNLSEFSNITIFGNDKDLLHNIRDGVQFHSINSAVNSITVGNFEHSIEKGKTIPFNTIAINKVLCGCTSDKIPAFTSEDGYRGQQLFDVYIKALKANNIPFIYENTTNPALFLQIMTKLGLVTDSDVTELQKRIKIIFPGECPEDVQIIPNDVRDIDRSQFAYFLAKYNDFNSIRCMGYHKMTLKPEDVEALRKKAYDLSSGATAVDNEIDVHNMNVSGQCLFLKEF